MCGLGGMARLGAGAVLTPMDRAVLPRMLEALAHRGPDETNIEDRGQVGMAFTRLSLVGVSSGNQPLHNGDNSIAVMANGEVYNHVELQRTLPDFTPRTRSDCEVLVPLYLKHGTRFLSEVRGILAVVTHDSPNRRLTLAVDPFANKPMFYTTVGDLVVFASEIKALFEHPDVPRSIDWPSSLTDQGFGNFASAARNPVNTWFAGIQKVAAGTVVTIDLETGATAVDVYWRPTFEDYDPDGPPTTVDEYVVAYRDLIVSSVSDSLMSEVGLGLFLSGGVDSAAVAAIASSLGSPLETFTVATEATILNGDVAASVDLARSLGIENTVLTLTARDVPSGPDWNRLLWLMESPLVGPEHYYKFSLHRTAKTVRPGLKAMLLGTGADEFNGGYSEILSHGLGWAALEANLAILALADRDPVERYWGEGPRRGLLRPEVFGGNGGGKDPYQEYILSKYRDVQQYNCWLEDRSAAGNGIEARVPFLDRRLVDLSTRVPRHLRAAALWDKEMARRAVREFLPEKIVRREKKPFFDGRTAGYAHQTILDMLRQNGGELVDQALSGPQVRTFIDADALHRAVRGSGGSGVHPEVLLRLVNLGLLDAALETVPRPFRADQVALLGSIASSGRQPELTAALAVFADLRPSSDLVLTFAAGTELAQSATVPDTWLLLQDHSVLFTLSASAAGEWLAFLRLIDGHRSVAEIAEQAAVNWEDFRDYLELCLERGLLKARTVSGAAG